MAPSTVFSYLRRDHRRPPSPPPPYTHTGTQTDAPSPSPQSPVASTNNPQPRISNPPQLPEAPQTPTLTDSLLESGLWAESEKQQQQQEEPHSERGGAAPLSSTTRDDTEALEALSAPPPTDVSPRPHTSGDAERRRSGSLGKRGQFPPSPTHGHHEKPTSPWRLAFGRNNNNNNDNININNDPSDSGKRSAGNGKGRSTHEALAPGPGLDVNRSSMDGQSPLSASSTKRETGNDDITVPAAHVRPGKTKLNLLNPLALLARRRSGQPSSASRADDIRVNRRELPALPDYDPRIRGKHVHDFSVPRPRSHVSANNLQLQSSNEANEQDQSAPNAVELEGDAPLGSGSNGAHDRTLVGQQGEEEEEEEDDDDGQAPQEISKDYSTERDRFAPPAPAIQGTPSPPGSQPEIVAPASGGEQQGQPTAAPSSTEGTSAAPSTMMSRSSTGGRDPSHATSGLPKHLHSSASRFSFDMAGMESSSQEKLLEQKHKEKEAARKADTQGSYFDDSDSEDIDFEAMFDDDGLEEEIPGVNVELDYDEYGGSGGIPSHAHPMKPRPLKQFVAALSPLVSNPVSPLELNSPSQAPPGGGGAPSPPDRDSAAPPPKPEGGNHLTFLSSPDEPDGAVPPSESLPETKAGKQTTTAQILSDDDFYFDDGMFDDDDARSDEGEEAFDESVFDDETSHLYDRKKTRADTDKPLPALPDDHVSETLENKTDDYDASLLRQNSIAAAARDGVDDGDATGHGHPLMNDSQLPAGEDLTEGNLQAYHSALAQAAHQAALKGRFDRRVSGSEASVENESAPHTVESQSELTANHSRVSQDIDQIAPFEDDALDDFDYDDRQGIMDEDDAIIAAANAEVLEYDDDEFYGQEFGFYAHSRGPGDSEPVYGGYFGSRGMEGVSRSHSGRAANFCEPSLTPITERSEWSTRNSIVSLAAAQQSSHSNASLSSPALAQLVDMGNIEDEMSLSALMKLRRGAFGGSNGSLRSSATSPASTSPTTGHQIGSLNGTAASSFHEAVGSDPAARPKSGMQNYSPSGLGGDGGLSADSSPGTLPLQDQQFVRGNVDVPPPLSVDTARANGE